MQTRVAKPEGLPSSEALLLDYAERLAKYLPGRRAVHIHLGSLQAANRLEHHLRMAGSAFDPLIKRAQGQKFCLANGDIVVVVKDVPVAQIDDIVLRLRYMFGEDPLVHVKDDAQGETKFCDWYDLELQYPAFLARAQLLNRAIPIAIKDIERAAAPTGAAPTPKVPLDPLRLSKLEPVIATADLKPLLRRRAIAELPAEGVKPVATELIVSLDVLGQRSLPDVDLRADRVLLSYLNRLLSRRLLGVLPEAEGPVPLPSWVSLSLATLTSPDFAAIDDRLRIVTRKPMVAQVRWEDVLRDVNSFLFVRDFLRVRKWQVALEGLTAANFALIDRATLEPDYLKLTWDANAADPTVSRRRATFLDALEQSAPGSVILTECNTREALAFGRAAKIALYQGKMVDSLLQSRASAA
jgi:hypothetical protein